MALRHHGIGRIGGFGRFGQSRRSRRYRRASAFTALAAVAIAMPITAGCSAVEKAIDCAQLAVEISTDVDNLQ
ncbi:hypothetical protein AB4Z54_68505, partial [Streptomyces sp. MCAF7]